MKELLEMLLLFLLKEVFGKFYLVKFPDYLEKEKMLKVYIIYLKNKKEGVLF